MSLSVRHIRLRANTSAGLYGTDISLDGGFTVLHAPNTSGKSTALHALLYALGLEQMLSPKRDRIPLSFTMRTHVEDPDTEQEYPIIESYVAVEIENAAGERITVKRFVTADIDKKLVQVARGPQLTTGGHYERRDYFVLDPGAAQREVGFHHMLARFMGWDLPTVKRYDGKDCLLYVETLFPLFFVEQKIGWTTIPAAIPTQFQIRDVHRRSVEYLMGFDTHEIELKRQDLDLQINTLRQEWLKTVVSIEATAGAAGLRVLSLPKTPTSMGDEVSASFLQVMVDGKWSNLDQHLGALREELAELQDQAIPEVEGLAEEARLAADQLNREIQQLNGTRNELFRERQAETVQQASTQRRIEHLKEDLQKHKDAKKLQTLGSTLGRDLSPHHCPTCDQLLDDVLLPQGTIEAVMTLDENIEYIDAQRKTFERLADRSVAAIHGLDLELLTTGDELRQKTTRLRALKTDLIAPSHAVSASFIEEKLRIEHRVELLNGTRARFDQQIVRLSDHAETWARLLKDKADLPDDRLSESDKRKLNKLEASIRGQLAAYQFITFNPTALTVSKDTYRPEKEGFEIGFELSASDTIRLKWAYQLGLLDVAMTIDTNHPHILVMDEPRQQEAAELSVAGLFSEAARVAAKGAQVLIATSERLESVEAALRNKQCQLVKFDGRLIRRLDETAMP